MSETLPPTPSSPTLNGANAKKYEGDGMPFKGKLIGMEDLTVDRDEKICLDSMFKLKAVAKARGEHKQRIQMNLTLSAVKVTDETSKTLVATHEIERISFVVLDPKDTRAFGYIYNTTDDRHQFWAIKTEKNAAATVLALKEVFELAFEIFTNEKGQTPAIKPSLPSPQAEITPAKVDPAVVVPAAVPEPVPVKEVPAPVPLLDWDTPIEAAVSPPPQPAVPTPTINLFDDLAAPLPPVTQPNPITTTPTDPLADIFGDLTFTAPSTETSLFGTLPPAPSTINNPTSMFPALSPVTSQPPTTTVQQDLLGATPISPIAPPTVTSPFAGLDSFDLLAGFNTGGKVTRDAFFNNQPAKQSIQQLQMEKKP